MRLGEHQLEDGTVIWRDENGLTWAQPGGRLTVPKYGLPDSIHAGARWQDVDGDWRALKARFTGDGAVPGMVAQVFSADASTCRKSAMCVGKALDKRPGFGRVAWVAASKAPTEFNAKWPVLDSPPQTLLLELSARALGPPGSPRVGYAQQIIQQYDGDRTLVVFGPQVPSQYEELGWSLSALEPFPVAL